jgi:proton-coupled amino acid transporter
MKKKKKKKKEKKKKTHVLSVFITLLPTHPHTSRIVPVLIISSSLIVANMLGAGVLGLPHAVSLMGVPGAVIVLIIITAASVYGGLLLGVLYGNDPATRDYGTMAERAFTDRRTGMYWRRFCTIVGYVYILGSCTIYLTTMKISIMQVLQKCTVDTLPSGCSMVGCTEHGHVDLHPTFWLLIAAAILYPFIHIRTMADISYVSYVGTATIAVVNVIVLVKCITAASHHSSTRTYSTETNVKDFVNGLTQLTFAYGGHVLMIDMLSSMKTPSQWPLSVYSSQFFMLVNYAAVG